MRKFITDILAKANLGVEQNAYVLGTVGIGTTSPSYKLDVQGNPGLITINTNGAVLAGSQFISGSGNFASASSGTDVTINAGGTRLMTLLSNGNVGIGTSSPSYRATIYQAGSNSDVLCVSNDQIDGSLSQRFVGISLQDQYANGSGNVSAIRSYSNLYSQWGSTLTFSTTNNTGNGVVEKMRITSTGNVGIGTTSPLSELHVQGTSTEQILISYDSTRRMLMGRTTGYGWISPYTNGVSYDNLVLVRDGGNVGIGTTSPNYKLHVSGNVYINETLFVNQLTTIEDSLIVYDNLGVGTTTPSSKFHVVTGTTGNIAIFQGGAGRYIITGTDGSGQYIEQVGNSSGERIFRIQNNNGSGAYTQLFLDGGNQRIYTSTNVNVGIGTSSPAYLLDVNGTARFGSATYKVLSVSDAGGAGWGTVGGVSTAPQLYMYSTGTNAVVQTYINNTARLEVTNTGITVTGAATFSSTIAATGATFTGAGSSILIVRSTSASGYATTDYFNSSNSQVASFGYGNASVVAAPVQNAAYIYTAPGIDFVGYMGGGERLRIASTGAATFSSSVTATNLNLTDAGGGAINNVNGNLFIQTPIGAGWIFRNGPSGYAEYMRLDPSGNLGIGTTSPSEKLAVAGRITLSGSEFSFSGDEDKNITVFSNRLLNLRTNDITRLTITGSGNVGIGTTNPQGKLDIAGEAPFVQFTDTTVTSIERNWRVGISDTEEGDFFISQETGDDTNLYSNRFYINRAGNVGIGTTSPGAKLHIGENGSAAQLWLQRTDGYNPVKLIGGTLADGNGFKVTMNTTDAFSITSSGNVGIGTTSPGARLNIAGPLGSTIGGGSSAIKMTNTDTGNFSSISAGIVGISNSGMEFSIDATTAMVITGTGDLLVGTTTSTYGTSGRGVVQVNGSSTAIFGLTISGTSAGYLYHTGTDMLIWNERNGYAAIGTNNTERVRITSAGNVGIGTTSPNYKLQVTGPISILNGASDTLLSGSSLYLEGGSGSNYTVLQQGIGRFIIFGYNGSSWGEKLTINNSSGNVGISTANPVAKLDVNGDISSSSLGLNVGGYNFYSQTISGVMGILGHNLRASNSVANQVNVVNSGWYSSMIKQYYSEGITFHTSTTSYTAGDVYPIAATERMRITAAGNVGIGTTSPQDKLTIKGPSDYNLNLGTLGGFSGIYVYNDASSAYKELRIDSASLILQSYSGGNVGIGTTSPTLVNFGRELVISQITGGQPEAFLAIQGNRTDDNNIGGVNFYNNSNFLASVAARRTGADNSGALTFNTSNSGTGSEKMRITSGGNVLIGTTTDVGSKLYVDGTIRTSGALVSGGLLEFTGGWSASPYNPSSWIRAASGVGLFLVNNSISKWAGFNSTSDFIVNSGDIYVSSSSGNVGIGTTSPGARLHVEGGNAIFNNGLADTILAIETDAAGLYDPIFQMGSGQNSIASEGFEIWYSNNVGDVHLSTTYSDAAASIRFHTATGTSKSTSNERMIITGTGNVGIGTTSPLAILDVYQTGQPQLRVRGTAGANHLYQDNTTGTTTGDGLFVGIGSDQTGYIYHYESNPLIFGTNNAERMRITASGNVGIGTTSPATALHVYNSSQGVARFESTQGEVNIALNNSSASGNLIGTVGAAFYFYSGGSERMRITSGGNVGVGIIPSAWGANDKAIEIGGSNSSTYTGLNVTSVAKNCYYDGTNWIYKQSGVSSLLYQQSFLGSHIFYNAGSGTAGGTIAFAERMRITDTGNVGIGTASPVSKLQVQDGDIRLQSSGGNPSILFGSYGVSTSYPQGSMVLSDAGFYGGNFDFYTKANGAATNGLNFIMRLGSEGNVGIGTTNPLYKLQVYNSSNGTTVGFGGTARGIRIDNDGTFSGGRSTIFGVDYSFYGSYQPLSIEASSLALNAITGGNVGIGTTSPGYKLQVNGAVGILAGVGNDYLTFEHPGTQNWRTRVTTDNTSSYIIGNDLGGSFNTKVLTLTNAGNVGIGTTSPTGYTSSNIVLHVHTALTNADLKLTNGTTGTGAVAGGLIRQDGNQMYIWNSSNGIVAFGTNNSERMRITAGGNVGIGTASPSARLDLGSGYGANGEKFFIYNDNSSSAFSGTKVGFYMDRFSLSNNVTFVFPTATSDPGSYIIASKDTSDTTLVARMTVLGQSGNVGIGTTSPTYKLDITGGDLRVSSGANTRLLLLNTSTNGLNYSIYSADTGNLIFGRTGIADYMTIANGGNVGIGTTSPSYKLHVEGTIYSPVYTSGSITINSGDFLFAADGGGDGFQMDYYNGQMYIGNNAGTSWHMVMQDNGNVGIGTTSPSALFHVSQASAATVLRIGNNSNYDQSILFNGGNDWSLGMDYSNSNAFVLSNYSSLGTNDRLVVTTGGNVGIGTTSPVVKFHVDGGKSLFRTTDNGWGQAAVANPNDTEVGFTWAAGGTGYPGVTSTYTRQWIAGLSPFGTGTDRWSLTNKTLGANTAITVLEGGNVGIGTTSPASKLDVAGNIKAGGTAAYNSINLYNSGASGGAGLIAYQNGTENAYFGVAGWYTGTTDTGVIVGTDSSSRPIRFYTSTERMRITGDGNVGIGTASPSYKLHVEGNTSGISIYASHDIAAFSDITVKKDVQKIENAIEKVKELNGYTYVRTDDETGTRRAGVIAQEVQKVLPEVVSANPDGTLNVAYSNMIALLIEGMKEQQATIERLENRIKQLEK
jgi:hypothetical protein